MSFTLKLWLGATGLLCALGLVLVGCSQPAEPTDAGERVVADRQSPIVSGAFEPTGKPDRKYIPPRELTAEELAEQRLTTIPNGVFVGYAEMMNPEEEIIELPTLYKARNIKPGPPPPLAIDLATGQVTVLQSLPDQPEPQPVENRPLHSPRTPGLEASFQGM